MKYDVDKERLQDFFSVFDGADTNTIAIADVGPLLRVAGLPVKEAHVKPFLDNWKEKGETRITFEDFYPVFQGLVAKFENKTPLTVEGYISVLSHYDNQGRGTVSQRELDWFLSYGEEALSDQEIHSLLHDTNALSDEVNIAEFVHTIMDTHED